MNEPIVYPRMHELPKEIVPVGPDRSNGGKMFPKIRGWVARDKDGTLVWYKQKPERDIVNFDDVGIDEHFSLNPKMFPNLKWEDEPIKAELIIRPL